MFRFLFPRRCVACSSALSEQERAYCSSCAHTVFMIDSPRCPQCAQPRESGKGVDEICGWCLERRPKFDASAIGLEYDGSVQTAFARVKFDGRASVFRPFFDAAAAQIPRLPTSDIVIVPPHPFDLFVRGFHPPDEFAQALERRFGPLNRLNVVKRVRRRKSRQTMDRDARIGVAKRAFRVTGRVTEEVVLVDDVVTTGGTVDVISALLKRAGAKHVTVVAAAKRV